MAYLIDRFGPNTKAVLALATILALATTARLTLDAKTIEAMMPFILGAEGIAFAVAIGREIDRPCANASERKEKRDLILALFIFGMILLFGAIMWGGQIFGCHAAS